MGNKLYHILSAFEWMHLMAINFQQPRRHDDPNLGRFEFDCRAGSWRWTRWDDILCLGACSGEIVN